MSRSSWWLAGVLLLALVAACGKSTTTDPGDDGGGGGNGGGTVADRQRDSILAATGEYFTALMASLPRDRAAVQMAQFLKTLPQFEDAGADGEGNAWGRFSDGRLAIFVNNFNLDDTLEGAAAVPRSAAEPAALGAENPTNIPASLFIRSCETLGAVFLNEARLVEDILRSTGYACPGYTAGSVEDLKATSDVGVFFISGHGGYGGVRGGGTEYAVWTGTEHSVALDSAYADDLDEHRLVYMFALYDEDANEKEILQWRYGFTGQFVRAYMSFASSSLVYISACSSASNNVFVSSFFAKGASVYAGFTKPSSSVFSRRAAGLFFDRAAGANYYEAIKEDPPQRPFAWTDVLAWMQANHYDYGDSAGTCRLVAVAQSGIDNPCGPLAPSIATMFVHPYENKLYLWGIFGEDPGQFRWVRVNNIEVPVLEWGYDAQVGMDKIVCSIPVSGESSYGNVMVAAHGIRSNVRQLSRYAGNFTLVHDTGDGRRYEVQLRLQFRVDLLSFRTAPGEEPVYNNASYVVHADMGSTGEYTCSGSTAFDDGALVWSGHDTGLHNNIDGGSAPRSFIAGAWFDPENRTMQLYMSGAIENGLIEEYRDGSGNVISNTQTIIFGIDTFDGTHGYYPSYAEIDLRDDFSIRADSTTAVAVNWHYGVLYPMSDVVKIKWENIACGAKPDSAAARVAGAPRGL